MIGWIIGGVVLVAVLAFVITTYNTLVRLRNKVKNSFAQIDTQLQRRFDLIPNLVETVKGFATHEKELLENVTASRNGYAHATSNGQKMAMNDQLTMGLRSLFAVVENYPDLKANTNFLKLQDELSVRDNGVGMDCEELNRKLKENNKDTVEAGSSIGIHNINARMKMLYGEEYGVTVESVIGEGTKVTLCIPRLRVEEVEAWKK